MGVYLSGPKNPGQFPESRAQIAGDRDILIQSKNFLRPPEKIYSLTVIYKVSLFKYFQKNSMGKGK